MSYLAVVVTKLPYSTLHEVIQDPNYKIRMDTESVLAEIFQVSKIPIICAVHYQIWMKLDTENHTRWGYTYIICPIYLFTLMNIAIWNTVHSN